MANLLFLILGLLVGYWCKEVYQKIDRVLEQTKEQKIYNDSGIVRPTSRVVRQVDLTVSDTGGVRRPSPDDAMLANIKERDARLKKM